MASIASDSNVGGGRFPRNPRLLTVAVFVVPPLMVSGTDVPNTVDRLAAQNAVRGTLIQALAGLALLGGATLTAIFSARTIRLNREGQITDRFTKAIDQLGNPELLEVRLGGIYALERIAQESPRDHWPIMEVLVAFLKGHPSAVESDVASAGAGEQQPEQTPQAQVRGADVQAAIEVIGRRKWIDAEPSSLGLRNADLRWLEMRGAHLERANLQEAHLEQANLQGAHLEQANLQGAHLDQANLQDAHLEGTDLWEAHLEGASLQGAHLEGASLQAAHLEGASLWEAHLEGANFWRANLKGATLVDAHLEGALLSQAYLEGANLMATSADSTTEWPMFFDPAEAGVMGL
jgi:uncharacterized protein YjbI with pentapeptide repeats